MGSLLRILLAPLRALLTPVVLMALALLGLAYRIQGSHAQLLRRGVATLGTVSLQIYLLHPALLQALERWWPPDHDSSWVLLGQVVCYALLATLIPAALGRALLRTRLSVLLFGR